MAVSFVRLRPKNRFYHSSYLYSFSKHGFESLDSQFADVSEVDKRCFLGANTDHLRRLHHKLSLLASHHIRILLPHDVKHSAQQLSKDTGQSWSKPTSRNLFSVEQMCETDISVFGILPHIIIPHHTCSLSLNLPMLDQTVSWMWCHQCFYHPQWLLIINNSVM